MRSRPYYDSMIAKLIVWGETRDQALARMRAALGQLHIVGVANNVAFLARLVGSAAFAAADLDTALIEREHELPVSRAHGAAARGVARGRGGDPVTAGRGA